MLDQSINPNPIIELMEAFRSSKAMFVAVSLGIFDRLERGATDLKNLALELDCQIDPMERLLDACVGLKLIRKHETTYSNETITNIYLCRTSPHTLVGYILYSNEVLYPLWSHLESAVRHGGHQWKQISKQEGGIFDHFFQTKEAMRTFLRGMHGLGLLSSPPVVSAFDLARFQLFVDIGGATGHLAIAICEKYPQMNAIVFDLPAVIDAICGDISITPVASRVEMMKGDMFDSGQIPEADLFGLSKILHDWTDEKVRSLLKGIHKRLKPGGGILIAEKLLTEDKTGPVSAQLQSLNMLVCTEGRERTLGEYRALLEATGFASVRGQITGAPLDAIFAIKA